MEYIRKNLLNGVTFVFVVLMAYFSGRAIVGNPGMSISGWLAMIAPIAVLFAAFIAIVAGSRSGHMPGGFLSLSSVKKDSAFFRLVIPAAAVFSVVIIFNPFDFIVTAFTGIILLLFVLSLYFLMANRPVDAVGMILLAFPFFNYAEFEISRALDFSSEWITFKIAFLLAFAFFWFFTLFATGERRLPKSRFHILLFSFVCITFASAMFSSNIAASLPRWLFEIVYPLLFYCIVAASIRDPADIRRFISYLVAGVFLNLAIVIYYFIKYGVGNLALNSYFLNLSFADGVLIANVLIMTIPITIALMIGSASIKAKMLYFILIMLGCAGLILSFGRMAQGSMIVGLLAFGLRRKTWKYIAVLVIVVLLLFMDTRLTIPYLSKYRELTSLTDAVQTSSMQKRYVGWNAALHMCRDHPVLGVGIGRYSEEYSNYAPLVYSIWASGYTPLISAHDIYLTYMAETGVTGALALGAIFFVIVLKGFQLAVKGGRDSLLKLALLISVGIFLINNCVDGITFAYVREIDKGLVFWSIAAVIIRYSSIDKQNAALHD